MVFFIQWNFHSTIIYFFKLQKLSEINDWRQSSFISLPNVASIVFMAIFDYCFIAFSSTRRAIYWHPKNTQSKWKRTSAQTKIEAHFTSGSQNIQFRAAIAFDADMISFGGVREHITASTATVHFQMLKVSVDIDSGLRICIFFIGHRFGPLLCHNFRFSNFARITRCNRPRHTTSNWRTSVQTAFAVNIIIGRDESRWNRNQL